MRQNTNAHMDSSHPDRLAPPRTAFGFVLVVVAIAVAVLMAVPVLG